MNNPYILEETNDFAVVFKPPKMHTTTINNESNLKKNDLTLLEWYAQNTTHVFDVMHRLDFETHGLVLFAKNENAYNFLKMAQDKGEFIKEYSAICNRNNSSLKEFPVIIESYFRPFGPGRKLVRPVVEDGKKHKEVAKDKGGFYRTEITNVNENVFTVRIKRGFRHQIRCHLCWIGFPIENDPLYGLPNEEISPESLLSLCSHALFFPDPDSGKILKFGIKAID
ncbi:MAG: RNA pseudouridine synthase [Treponema sp.]|jgi:23S rRNA pseudouridine1911/1915/1917 synthase|nr:RNA pseudouridine synthase [Treponema sp.]